MAASLYRFAFRRYYVPEVLAWLERFIEADTTPGPARARTLNGLGMLTKQPEQAASYFEEAIDLHREFGPKNELGIVLYNAGANAMATGDWEQARTMVAESNEILDEHPGLPGANLSLQAYIALWADHDPDRAVELAEAVLELAKQSNSLDAIYGGLVELGFFRREAGDLEGADAALSEALKASVDSGGMHSGMGRAELHLSKVALDRGDVDQAALHLEGSATLTRALYDETLLYAFMALIALHLWAEVAVRRQRHSIAVTLLGAQTALYDASPVAQFPTERAEAEDTLGKARAGLDPESFDRAWDKGTAMSGTEVLKYAVDQLGSGAQPTK
jgi:tetratricopeptide (TPR) repeat protein